VKTFGVEISRLIAGAETKKAAGVRERLRGLRETGVSLKCREIWRPAHMVTTQKSKMWESRVDQELIEG